MSHSTRPFRLRLSLAAALALGASAGSATAQDIHYVHLDALGNVRALTDQNGNVVERHDYLPFGEECVTGPCAANPPAVTGQPLRFTGKERDPETGLDYFGARYYQPRWGRFTTVDPVYAWRENVVDPQRWNRYAYARNNPLRYLDPDGREVTYANDHLKTYFGFLSARSRIARETLQLYTGPGKPDLLITHAEAGKDIDGRDASGNFRVTDYTVNYAGKEDQIKPGMTVEQIEDLGTWAITGGTLTLDSSLTINVQDKSTIGTALHELGHADQAARQPLQYKRDAPKGRRPDGSITPHDDRPTEAVANQYRDRALQEVRP